MRIRTAHVARLHEVAAPRSVRDPYVRRNEVGHLLLAGRPDDAAQRRRGVHDIIAALRTSAASRVGDELRVLARIAPDAILVELAKLLDRRGSVLALVDTWPNRARAFLQLVWEHEPEGALADWLKVWCDTHPRWTWLARSRSAAQTSGARRAWSFGHPVKAPCLGVHIGAARAILLDEQANAPRSMIYGWRRQRLANQHWSLQGVTVRSLTVCSDTVLAWDGATTHRFDTRSGACWPVVPSTRAPVALDPYGWFAVVGRDGVEIWLAEAAAPSARLTAAPDVVVQRGEGPNGALLVTDAMGLRIWTPEAGTATLDADRRRARHVAMSATGVILVAGSRSVRRISREGNKLSPARDLHERLAGEPIRGCALHAEGALGAIWSRDHLVLLDDRCSPIRVEPLAHIEGANWIGAALIVTRRSASPVYVPVEGAVVEREELRGHGVCAATENFVVFRRLPNTAPTANPPAVPAARTAAPEEMDAFFRSVLAGESGTMLLDTTGSVRPVTPPDGLWPAYVARSGPDEVVSCAPAARSVHAWNPLHDGSESISMAGFPDDALVLPNGDAFVIGGSRLHHLNLATATLVATREAPSGARRLYVSEDVAHLTDGYDTWRVAAAPLSLIPVPATSPKDGPPKRSGRPSHGGPLKGIHWFDDEHWFTAGDDGKGHVLAFGSRGVVVLHAIRDGALWLPTEPTGSA